MPKKLLSQLLQRHRSQYLKTITPVPLPPELCLVFQRHHTMIYNVAQLLIWFITESQIGTFKVMVNRQLAPGR